MIIIIMAVVIAIIIIIIIIIVIIIIKMTNWLTKQLNDYFAMVNWELIKVKM